MGIYFSSGLGTFVDEAFHKVLPADAVPVSRDDHARFLAARRAGHRVEADARRRPRIVRVTVKLAQRRTDTIARVRDEARRRILAVASIERQTNDNAAIAQMALQLALTATTTIDAAAACERRTRIEAIRARGAALRTAIARFPAASLDAFDPTDEGHWAFPASE